MGDVRIRLARLVVGEYELDDQNSPFDLFTRIHIRNVVHQQTAGADFEIVTFVTQVLQICDYDLSVAVTLKIIQFFTLTVWPSFIEPCRFSRGPSS